MAKEKCDEHSGCMKDIENLKSEVRECRQGNKTDFADVWKAINSLRNRLPVWATFLIGGLMSLVTGMAVYLLTKGAI